MFKIAAEIQQFTPDVRMLQVAEMTGAKIEELKALIDKNI